MSNSKKEPNKIKYTRPGWVVHQLPKDNKRQPIYCVNVHPSGERFATGGGDGKVKIWSTKGLIEEAPNSKNLLATLDKHQGTVSTVAWSPDGRYLASGSDDNLVMVWHLTPGQQATPQFGSAAVENVENWSLCVTFKGHTMDVQDVAWSPDSGKLASCSIDNKIMVWQVDKPRPNVSVVEGVPLAVLEGHSGWVKGVSWDPVGRYLCSTSTDNSVIFWRCSDWEQEAKVTKPFSKSLEGMYTRQVSWSPDGCHLCATHGIDQTRHVAYMVERHKWNDDAASPRLVGHTKAITACAFSPAIHQVKGSQKYSTMCAISGLDHAISVWVTGSPKPYLNLKNLFESHCLGVSWSADGTQLLAVSLDGHLVCLSFSHSTLGDALSPAEKEKLLRRRYGDLTQESLSSSLLETPKQLEMEHAQKQRQVTLQTKPPPATAVHTVAKPQKESVTSTGRRRISPALLTQVTPSAASSPVAKRPRTAHPAADGGHGQGSVRFPPAEVTLRSSDSIRVEPSSLPAGAKHTIRTSRDATCTTEVDVVHGPPQDDLDGARMAVLTHSTNGRQDWRYQVLGKVSDVVGNRRFTAAVVSGSQIHVLGGGGRPLLPPVDFGCSVAALFAAPGEAPFLMAVSTEGRLWVWNIDALHATVAGVLVQPLGVCAQPVRLSEAGESRFVQLMVTQEGVPVLLLAQRARGGEPAREECAGFSFHAGMRTWVRVADPSTHLRSRYKSSLGRHYVDSTRSLAVIQATMNDADNRLRLRGRSALKASALFRSSGGGQASASAGLNQREQTRLHLETQLAAALALKSYKEYTSWLQAYMAVLRDEQDVKRIRSVCNELLGPETRKSTGGLTPVDALGLLATNDLMAAQQALATGDDGLMHFGLGSDGKSSTFENGQGASAASKYWAPMILGYPKRQVLKSVVIPILTKSRTLQRVVQDYVQALERIEKVEKESKETETMNGFSAPSISISSERLGQNLALFDKRFGGN